MQTVRRIVFVSVLILSGLVGVAQSQPSSEVSPELYLELGAMTTDNSLEDQNVLFLDLNMDAGGRDWTVPEPSQDAGQPGQGQTLGDRGVLVLELSPLTGPGGLARTMGVDEDFVSDNEKVLLLEFGMIPEELSEEDLETRQASLPEDRGMLILALDYTVEEEEDGSGADSDSGGQGGVLSNPATLLLELASITGDVSGDIPDDTLLLQLEALQGGPALRQPSDFYSHLLAMYAPSLIGHWRLWEGEGHIAWDYSGYDHDGTFVNRLAWTSEGLQFDGGHIVVPYADTLEVDEALTMTTWVYLPDPARYQTLLGKLSPDQMQGFLYRVVGGQFSSMIWDTSGDPYPDVWQSISAKTWTHLAVTWETGGDLIGYLNGVEVGQIKASANPISDSGDELIIGADPLDTLFAQVNGLISDIRLYDVPLSAMAIQILATGWGHESWEGEGIAGGDGGGDTPGGGEPGSGGGAYHLPGSFGLTDNNPELMITEDVLKNLEAEGMDPKIIAALTELKDRRFTETGNNTYVLVKAVKKEMFKLYEDTFKNKTQISQNDLPEELRDTLKKIVGIDYGKPEDLENAVKKELAKVISWKTLNTLGKLVKHANVQQEFMITEAALKKLATEDYVKSILRELKNKRFLSLETFEKALEKLNLQYTVFNDTNKKELLQQAEVGDDEFVITQEVLDSWSNVPDLKDRLQGLQDQRFVSEDAFTDAMQEKLGESDFEQHKYTLMEARIDDFSITRTALKQLKEAGVSEEIRKKLKKLIGQQFGGKEDFTKVVKDAIGEENFNKVGFKENLVTHAKMEKTRSTKSSRLASFSDRLKRSLKNRRIRRRKKRR